MKYKCIIVDDEPISRDILRSYLEKIPELQLNGEFRDALEANHFIKNSSIDILFLDINMPGISGISFARSLNIKPELIFTTAYPEYAVEGFDLDATDYLVKPYSFERFLKAVNKATARISKEEKPDESDPTILVRAGKKIHALKSFEISHVEGCGDYIRIFLRNKSTIIVHDTMKGFLEKLPETNFMRCHKSFIINLQHIEYIDGNQLSVNDVRIPVSPGLKAELLSRMG